MVRLLSNLAIRLQHKGDLALDALRLRVYTIAFPIGMCALVIVYILDYVQGTVTQFQRIGHPIIAIATISAAVVVSRNPRYLRAIERLGFVFVALFMVVRFWAIIFESTVVSSRQMLITFPQWLPMVYFMAFLMFKTRQALFASVAFYGLLLIPVLVIMMQNGLRGFEVFDLNSLIQLHLAHAVYIPLLSGIALLKEHYVRASERADALAAIATIDYLTGAANRRHSEQQLNQMIEQAQRYEHQLSIILLDIDSFKLVNDAHGHSTGDQVLIRLVEILREHLRASDICGRWGGEEFIIIAPETPLDQAILLADRLRAIIASESIAMVGRVTVSLGVAELQPNETAQAVVKRADQALYQAKQNGRNRVEANHA